MATIRPYKEQDREAVRSICLACTGAELYPALYLDYYLEFEPENAFVAVNEEDQPVGYIVCSNDYNCFCRRMVGYVKRRVIRISYGELGRIDHLMEQVRALHPGLTTHCFWNILPDYRLQGILADLLDALCAELGQHSDPYLSVVGIPADSHRHEVLLGLGFEDFGQPAADGTIAMIRKTA